MREPQITKLKMRRKRRVKGSIMNGKGKLEVQKGLGLCVVVCYATSRRIWHGPNFPSIP